MRPMYQKEIGYQTPAIIELDKRRYLIRTCRLLIDNYYRIRPQDKILVAGVGDGSEAAEIHNEFKIFTVGVDINIKYSGIRAKQDSYFLHQQDLSTLAFRDNSFSLIYCYHVLEHVSNPSRVLYELHRVLTNDGILFIGFPNKHRIFAYLGTSQKLTIKEKVLWNVNDYRYKIARKFENKYGAHAGFTEYEYLQIASKIFYCVIPVRNQYMLLKHKKFNKLVNLIVMSKLSEYLFPSNYFICKKISVA